MAKINVHQLLITGTLEQIRLGDEKEKKAIGTLRAGNTGMINEKGQIIGSCAGEAYLRMLGLNLKKVDLVKELMFAGGRANETLWVDSLKSAPVFQKEGFILKQEEEIPISWQTDNGIKVTGRPDIILCDPSAQPIMGIELKQVMSSYTAYNVLFKNEPMLKHLMQAAHYMWQLNIPYEIWYTNRTMISPDSFMGYAKDMPRPGEPLSEHITYRYYRLGEINARSGKPTKHKLKNYTEYMAAPAKQRASELKKFQPFVKGFKLELLNGTLYYQDLKPGSPWVMTCVTVEGIQRFYNFVAELEQYGKVPKPYINADINGVDLGFSFESELGEFSLDQWQGKPLTDWINQIKNVTSNKDK